MYLFVWRLREREDKGTERERDVDCLVSCVGRAQGEWRVGGTIDD